jgi:prepilin-type N-terminal cleavage/methylation domain-containing protein
VSRRRHHRRHRRAFTIAELLLAIGVLAIFAAAATQLFHLTFRVSHATAQRQDAVASFDSALTAMRDDAWVATEIAASDPATAKLGKVTWSVKETKLTRDAGDGRPARMWPAPKGLTFATDNDGVALLLRVPASAGGGERGGGGGDVRMISQPRMLSRLTPP